MILRKNGIEFELLRIEYQKPSIVRCLIRTPVPIADKFLVYIDLNFVSQSWFAGVEAEPFMSGSINGCTSLFETLEHPLSALSALSDPKARKLTASFQF